MNKYVVYGINTDGVHSLRIQDADDATNAALAFQSIHGSWTYLGIEEYNVALAARSDKYDLSSEDFIKWRLDVINGMPMGNKQPEAQHSSAPQSPALPVEVHVPDEMKADGDARMAALRALCGDPHRPRG